MTVYGGPAKPNAVLGCIDGGGVFRMREAMDPLCCGSVTAGASLQFWALGYKRKIRQRMVTGYMRGGGRGGVPELVTDNKGTGEFWPGHNCRRT